MPRFAKWLVALLLLVGVAMKPAGAQIVAGDRSIAVQGLFVTGTGDADVTFGMGLFAFNKFQTSKFAWRILTLVQVSESGGETDTQTGFGGGLEWNFNTEGKTTIPFVAVDVTMFTGQDESLTLLSPSAGFRSFVSRSTSFDVALSYNTILSGAEEGSSGGLIMARLGFSFYLGKDPRR